VKIVCQIVGHQRSAHRAKFDYEIQAWKSVCKHCGEAMVRTEDNQWHIKSFGKTELE
jgi:hypothetical protein